MWFALCNVALQVFWFVTGNVISHFIAGTAL